MQEVTSPSADSTSAGFLKNTVDIKKEMVQVLCQEAEAICNVTKNFPKNVEILVKKLVTVCGKVVFSGCGKSGLVSRKLAATFSSVGIPSVFLHPSDALHGDLGMIQPDDLFIALSKSGTGSELEHIFLALEMRGVQTFLLCCEHGSLGSQAGTTICLPFKKEACNLNLAPTSSSTITMAFGDALAIVVSKIKNFTAQDFACFHPAGVLGKKLLIPVKTLMYSKDNLPLLLPNDLFQDLLVTITSKKLGVGIVVDKESSLLGIITDGDLRRSCSYGPTVFSNTACDIMTKNMKTICPDVLAHQALVTMEKFNITSLVVVQESKVVGLIHIHDIIKAGIKE